VNVEWVIAKWRQVEVRILCPSRLVRVCVKAHAKGTQNPRGSLFGVTRAKVMESLKVKD
jgi:hypothetical protein